MQREPNTTANSAAGGAASGAISDELDRMEVTAGKIGMNRPESAFSLLRSMDTVYQQIDLLEPGSQSRKLAETQFEIIHARLRSETGTFLRDLGGSGALERERAAVNPPREHDWWYLDELQQERRRRAIKRALITLAAAALVLAVVSVVYQRFFAPDPKVVAVYGHEQAARDALFTNEPEKALAEVDQGLQVDPRSESLLVMRGVTLERMGREAEAGQAYQQAQGLFSSMEEFLVTRGQIWVFAGDTQRALADAQAALQENPDFAQAYLLAGQAYEVMEQYEPALDNYNLAYDAAEKAGQSELAAVTRTRMAMLMQVMNSRMLPEEQAATPAP